MSKPFDVTLKHMLEDHPVDCARLMGVQTTAPIDVIDGDVSTVSAMADKVLRIAESQRWLLHFEFQASYEADLSRRMLQYNVLLNGRHGLPVRSAVVLLRREADGPEMTGSLRQTLPGGRQYLEFRYDAIRIWEVPVETILQGGLGTLPLAPIAAGNKMEAASAVQQMKRRLAAGVSPAESSTIWAQTKLLLGLRYHRSIAADLLRGVQTMKESDTYQEIIEEGAMAEARKFLLFQGEDRFGAPDERTRMAIEAVSDLPKLELLGRRLIKAGSWEELLGQPRPKRRTGRKRKS